MSADRVISAVNRGRRIDEIRSADAQDNKQGALTLFDHTGDASSTEGGAAWGARVWAFPFDVIELLLDYTAGVATTGVEIRAQVSEYDNPTDASWHDLYVLDPATGVINRWKATLPSAVDARIAVQTEARPKWMRFKVWTPGGDQTGAVVLLKGVFDKLSL